MSLTNLKAKPFLKWVGGKRWLAPTILKLVKPLHWRSYYEPFLGGGALFFALSRRMFPGRTVILSDTNSELIQTFCAVRDDVATVIEHLKRHAYAHSPNHYAHSPNHYNYVRRWNTTILSLPEYAARMIYLNRTCFNGLYRVNKNGEFNVPCGRYTDPLICDVDALMLASKALQGTRIVCSPFGDVVHHTLGRDLVYLDPPYDGTFNDYGVKGFGRYGQECVANIFETLIDQGCYVLLSNSATQWVVDRYAKHKKIFVTRKGTMNSDPSKRGSVPELLIMGNI